MHSRRALLDLTGKEMRKIEKTTTLGVDCACLDLEAGVALNRKNEARTTVADALRQLSFGTTERLVRINPVGSGRDTAPTCRRRRAPA